MKNCPSYPGYSVTKDGRVFTHRRKFGLGKGKGGGVKIDPNYNKELGVYVGHGGYPYCSISSPNGQRSIPIHVLIMDAFVGPRPDGMEIRHKDGNPLNLDLNNLSYGTVAENAADRIAHGRQPRGESHGKSILNNTKVREIRILYAKGLPITAISRHLNIKETTVRDVISGKRWSHIS